MDTVLYLPHAVYAPVWLPIVIALGVMAIGATLIRAGARAFKRT